MGIKVIPLGAGQGVGRSCVIVELGGRRLMFDCGIHMVDEQKFPDFYFLAGSALQKQNFTNFTDMIDCVLITHFHLDHCGALAYFSEIVGYDGPIVATAPTKAIIPLMLEDFRKITAFQQQNQKQGQQVQSEFTFTSDNIKNCISKIRTIQLYETQLIKDDIKVTCYYAGHVLGACMFYVECNGESVVYTGDYNMTADRHLGAAWIDKLKPDLVITETTYATTVRDSKRSREREFLKQVHDTLDNGGKVLIPVFALGRAQELCVLLETYWERTNLQYPIFFTGGLTEKANFYYKLFINWTNEKIKKTFNMNKNVFQFKHVKLIDTASIKSDQPMVCFASPGMLHGGYSLQIFKEWAGSEKNTLIIPGYCMPGTVGNKLLNGEKKIMIDGREVHVKIQIYNMSFSAHADSKGIMELLSHLQAKNVMLVHGEKEKMKILAQQVKETLGVNCYYPANFTVLNIKTEPKIHISLGADIVKEVNQIYGMGHSCLYKANSDITLTNCLIGINDLQTESGQIELMKQLPIDQNGHPTFQNKSYQTVDMRLTWQSQQTVQSDKFIPMLIERLAVEIMQQKKLELQIEEFVLKEQEIEEATESAKVLADEMVVIDKQDSLVDNFRINRHVIVNSQSLDEPVAQWVISIVEQLIA